MKSIILIIIGLIISLYSCQPKLNYQKVDTGVNITLPNGTLGIYPLSDNAVRVKFVKDTLERLPELVLTSEITVPEYEVSESGSAIEVKLKSLHVIVDNRTGDISYADASGKVFLSEKAGTRKLVADTIMGEKCYLAEQVFDAPEDEYIFGLGQFQDGNYNLKGITRKLTQVNTQIALPFIFSSRGYGLLWHQYGLTEFNPTENLIEINKQEQTTGEEEVVEVTTTAGTKRVARNQSLYKGSFSVPQDGEYSIFLDLGDMGNRHFMTIDGNACFDLSNMWLGPTAGTLVELKAGEHQVQLICKSDNQPKVSWKLKENTTTFRSPVAKMMDYVVFYGPQADSVIESYRSLSGNVPMFPKWAYGFWQCRERYTSSKHLIETVKEFRQRKLPMDVIVQDWQYWGSRGWGVPQFDLENYPDPAGFIKEIHDLNTHFSISIWSNPDKNSDIGKEYVANNRFIGETKWLDYFNPATRDEYWNTLRNNMFDFGVDSWWMDAVEPENDALKGERTYAGIGDFYRLTYPLMVSKAVYEGQRNVSSDKRVCILTRSAFLGQQRYGVINWSGDIGGNWDSYKRQIVAGLNFTITGLPYWTTDIGGFFRPGPGQYTDANFQELLIRWFQWGSFSPIFRSHGYMTETEPWKFGDEVEQNVRNISNTRYRLIPYIYSEAWQVTNHGSTMMRPMVMDFSEDKEAIEQSYQYMFGQTLLVAPVIEPGVKKWDVYLPKNHGWYNFWTNYYVTGGQTIPVEASLDKIPLFVKAGAILPMGEIKQHTTKEIDHNLEIRVYKGADGSFELYEDEGDNYNYEKGKYSIIPFEWNDGENTLFIGSRAGTFEGMPETREFNLILINPKDGVSNPTSSSQQIKYNGEKIEVKF